MKEEFDVSQVESAVEHLQRNYRRPLPGVRLSSIHPIKSHPIDSKSPSPTDAPAGE
jgi:hypothetical protein